MVIVVHLFIFFRVMILLILKILLAIFIGIPAAVLSVLIFAAFVRFAWQLGWSIYYNMGLW